MMLALIMAASVHGGHDAQQMPQTHAGHDALTYWMVGGELDVGRGRGGAELFAWDIEAWVGGDQSRLWLTSEGDAHDGHVEHAEMQALYGAPISEFWDVQLGVRYDIAPDGRAYLVAGVKGLAPHFLETDAKLFLSDKGDVSFRLKHEIDVLLSQRLILTPAIELEGYAQDVPQDGKGAGLSDIKADLTLRDEIARKFAPYMQVSYERALGETAGRTRAAGERVDDLSVRVGVRFWFN
jgi:copper resistance protein B